VKSNDKLLIAALAGLLAGAAGNSPTHGQQAKPIPVYLISEADVITDTAGIEAYGSKVGATLAPFSGHDHFVVRGGKTESLEGQAPEGTVIIAFDSFEQARAWYNSPAYQAIKPLRQAASKGRMFIVAGLAQ